MIKTASILTIGDELLIGQVIDTNSAWLGQQLSLLGIEVTHTISVGDEVSTIVTALQSLEHHSDLIIISGGLGPTADDKTIDALTQYLEVEKYFDEELYTHISKVFALRNIPLTEGHRLQCHLPKGTQKLANRLGSAPGMLFKKEDTYLISLPGVPYEMKAIVKDNVLTFLKEQSDTHILHETILTAGVPESTLADSLVDIESALPHDVKLAYLPSLQRVRIRLTTRGKDSESIRETSEVWKGRITERLGDIVFGYGDISLAEAVGKLCVEKGICMATAESCTGGAISGMIVSNSGSSAYYAGSIIAYANDVKVRTLGVSEDTLAQYGAVSKETVTAMLEGLLDRIPADVGIAVSGIAGPSGGTPEKPVGTIWVAVGDKDHIETQCLKGGKDRGKNIQFATTSALNLLRKFLIAR